MSENERLKRAIRAATSAGRLLMRHWQSEIGTTSKESLRDVVTSVDRAAEATIVDCLRAGDPGVPILGEEAGLQGEYAGDGLWVVDALDGTVNYVNRVPLFCVSIAFFRAGDPVLGVIFNPMANDLYFASVGRGAFKNQSRIRVRSRGFEECLFGVAFSGRSYAPAERAGEFLLMKEVNDVSRGCLRTGSAAMNLAYLAEGRFGGCWGHANKLWDVGAGLLIARLAGADVAFGQIDEGRHLVSYRAAVPQAAAALACRTDGLLGLGRRASVRAVAGRVSVPRRGEQQPVSFREAGAPGRAR